MSKQVEFYFDFGSPYSYIAYRALPPLCKAQGAQIAWRPMLLGAVFQATGNHSPAQVPAKRAYLHADMQQWARHYGAAFAWNPHFIINTLLPMRGATGFQLNGGELPRYIETMFSAMWEQQRNLGDPAVLADVLQSAGFDPQAFLAMVGEAAVKEQLKSDTEAAVARGVFGAPTFFVDNRMFWGQDRLMFVEQALAQSR